MKNHIACLILALTSVFDLCADSYTVNASVLNVRENTSKESAVIGTLTDGESVEVLKIENDWAAIEYAGRRAYVKSSYLTEADGDDPATTQADNEGIIHRFLSIFSNEGEALWFTIVKWIIIVIIGSVLLRYGLSLLTHMLGFGAATGIAGLAIGAMLYWLDIVAENTMWNMGTYGFYIGCGLALIYLIFNFREWRDDASTILKRTSSPAAPTNPDGLERYTVHDDYGIPYHLTQDHKNSKSYFTDQYGKHWVHDSSGFRRI